MNLKSIFGKQGEDICTTYCKQKLQYEILHRNYKCKNYGEIDIIAKKGNSIIFIEVKSRANNYNMEIWEQIDARKLKALKRAVDYIIAKENYQDFIIRVDAMTYNKSNNAINYYENIYE